MAEEATLRPLLIALLLSAGSMAGAAGAQSRAAPEVSWGKAGVSLEDYWTDSVACAVEAVNLDVANTRAAQRLVAASSALNATDNSRRSVPSSSVPVASSNADFGADYGRIRDMYEPDRQFDAIESLQQRTLDRCLANRGYRQFRLTDDQRQRLRRFDHGSDARRVYLHSLAADPDILRQQGL